MVADPTGTLVVLAMISGGGNHFHLEAVPMDGASCEARVRRMPDNIVAECMPMTWWIEEQKKPRCSGALCRR
jgi:hypothetical protein